MKTRVLIVDDQSIPRQLFESIIQNSERYEVAESLSTAKVADIYCAGGRVDMVLMDIVMSDDSNGLTAAARIKAAWPEIRIIAVTSMPDAELMTLARRAGVDSFWFKEAQDVSLLALMDRTMAGEKVWPDRAPRIQLGAISSEELTNREMEVLHLMAAGLTNFEIADRLGIAYSTIRTHVKTIQAKTGCRSRTEAALLAARNGLAVSGNLTLSSK